MAHSLTTIPAATSALISTGSSTRNGASASAATEYKPVCRRAVTLGLSGALLGLSLVGDRSAKAAGRRPPPPPPREKQDPNVSGVVAKVMASKKRKEAMEEAVAKLRERGKPVELNQTPE